MKYCVIHKASGHIENIILIDDPDSFDLPNSHELREWQEGDEIYAEPPPEPEPEPE